MKNLTTKLTIAAAVIAVAAGAASAQTMKADVPFAFRTVNGTLEAGTYTVSIDRSAGTVHIRQAHGNESAFLLPTSPIGANKESEAKLVFSCGAGPCTLVQVWTGPDRPAYQFRRPKQDRNEEASLVAIPLQRGAR